MVCAGRRGGKTTLVAEIGIERMCINRRVLLSSTTQDQADAFWEKARTWLAPAIQRGILYKNETRRIIALREGMAVRATNLPGHLKTAAEREADEAPEGERTEVYRAYTATGRIKVKTAYNADGLRGDYADELALDECARLDPTAWYDVCLPMLLDNDGNAYLISTPNRRNWFYKVYAKGLAEMEAVTKGEMALAEQRWASFHFTSHDNPFLSAAALAELTADMDEDSYRQEILAQFLEGEGSVFRKVEENLTADLHTTPGEHAGHAIVLGGDWGRHHDRTAFSVVCVTCGMEVALEYFTKIDFGLQRMRLGQMIEKWRPQRKLIEGNSIGEPNIELLNDQGFEIEAFWTTGTSKGPLIRLLALTLERGTVRWRKDAQATAELLAYEQKVSAVTGKAGYSAPDGENDDTVIARALAVMAAFGPQGRFAVLDAAKLGTTQVRDVPKTSPLAGMLLQAAQIEKQRVDAGQIVAAGARAVAAVAAGTPVTCTALEYAATVRAALQAQAAKWVGAGDVLKAVNALEEVRRLDRKFAGGGNGDGQPE